MTVATHLPAPFPVDCGDTQGEPSASALLLAAGDYDAIVDHYRYTALMAAQQVGFLVTQAEDAHMAPEEAARGDDGCLVRASLVRDAWRLLAATNPETTKRQLRLFKNTARRLALSCQHPHLAGLTATDIRSFEASSAAAAGSAQEHASEMARLLTLLWPVVLVNARHRKEAMCLALLVANVASWKAQLLAQRCPADLYARIEAVFQEPWYLHLTT